MGFLVVVLNCELHVFTGMCLCIKGERVVVAAGHFQVACAVKRLFGSLVEGIVQLGMFCNRIARCCCPVSVELNVSCGDASAEIATLSVC